MNEAAQEAWNACLIRAGQSDGIVDFSLLKDENGALLPLGTAIVDARLFKDLYVSRLSSSPSSLSRSACVRWRVKGGRFSQTLDLSDERQPGSRSLPALEFEDCFFPEGFCADNASIQRLTFSGCHFGAYTGDYGFVISIGLRNTQFEGDLKMQRLHSLREDGLLTIAAPAMNAMGSVRLSDTVLTSTPDSRQRGEDRVQYALNLSEATIRDDLHMVPRVVIRGGLNIRYAHIGAELGLGDMSVNDGLTTELRRTPPNKLPPRAAIEGTGVSVGGNVFFQGYLGCERFTCEGTVSMYGFETKSSLVLTGASFDAAGAEYALGMTSSKVGGDLIADEELRNGRKSTLRMSGVTDLMGVHVNGRLALIGTLTELRASRLRVEGDVTLSTRMSGDVNLGGADLKGQLDLSSFSFDKDRKSTFSLRDADIGHTLRLAGSARALTFMGCRRAPLLCYPGYHVFEIWFREGTATLLYARGQEPLLLEGSSDELHRLSKSGKINLNTPEAIREYLRFFGAYVWGGDKPEWEDLGAFQVVEGRSGFPPGSFSEALGEAIAKEPEIQLDSQFTDQDWKLLKEALFTDPSEQPDDGIWTNCQIELAEHGALARSFVRLTSRVFWVTFFVFKKPFTMPDGTTLHAGNIRMLSDDDIGVLDPEKLPVYDRPLVLHNTKGYSDYSCDHWKAVPRTELSLLIPRWNEMLEKRLARFQNAIIDLTNASCRTLDDAHGRAWGLNKTTLHLENFVYSNINHSTQAAHTYTRPRWSGNILLRLHRDKENLPANLMKSSLAPLWLRTISAPQGATEQRQAWLARIPRSKFTHQPYTQLANVLSASGDDEGAKVIEEARIGRAVMRRSNPLRGLPFWLIFGVVLAILASVKGPRTLWLAPLIFVLLRSSYLLGWGAFKVFFRYGLSPGRATCTMLLCLAAGWWGVNELNERGFLIQNTSTVATLVEKDAGGNLEAVFPYAEKRVESSDLRCGPTINGLLYATDVFIPLLDLRQETKCDIRSLHKEDVDPDKEWSTREKSRVRFVRYMRAVFRSRVWWAQFAKSFYAILGWMVTSLTILTYSGILRRWAEK